MASRDLIFRARMQLREAGDCTRFASSMPGKPAYQRHWHTLHDRGCSLHLGCCASSWRGDLARRTSLLGMKPHPWSATCSHSTFLSTQRASAPGKPYEDDGPDIQAPPLISTQGWLPGCHHKINVTPKWVYPPLLRQPQLHIQAQLGSMETEREEMLLNSPS